MPHDPLPFADKPSKYLLWETQPAPNRGADFSIKQAKGYPFDKDWEEWSYSLGNGYMGANVFGRTDVERIQITEKTVCNMGPYDFGGLTNFLELYLEFEHTEIDDYLRTLDIESALASVNYKTGGVCFGREMFMSYPDKVLAIHLFADQPGILSFRIRAEIPYLQNKASGNEKTCNLKIENGLITLSGTIQYFNLNFEAQIRILCRGGMVLHDQETVSVNKADSVTILFAAGTNYQLRPETFLNDPGQKLDPDSFPHEEVSKCMKSAESKGYDVLRERHLSDYTNLFQRVALDLNTTASSLPTSELLGKYKSGEKDRYLEELMYQYGRYLLIASSREKSLPANLQGAWSQYEVSPWSGGYWHNINVQMNYWGAMSANLAETFEAYISFFKAYYPRAKQLALEYVKKHNPQTLKDTSRESGWILGTAGTPYFIGEPGGHSGPGTGGMTSKLLMDYYQFTQDEEFLRKTAYPALLGMSQFFAKALHPTKDGMLLIEPSASPEMWHEGKLYGTVGCTFDQGFVWENHSDVIETAGILGEEDLFLETIREQLPRLDPIQIGSSGQIKEFREENSYGEIGEKEHRHISHLCPLYPGTLINSSKPEWRKAASRTLDLRGDHSTGWAMAHRMLCRARLNEGNNAHRLYRLFIAEKTVPNLWTLHPPFQIDGNLGVMAGVTEMLLQSHEGFIALLPALPEEWPDGDFEGLVARGNFVVSAQWKSHRLIRIEITSRSGGLCRVKMTPSADYRLLDCSGKIITILEDEKGVCSFSTMKGSSYRFEC